MRYFLLMGAALLLGAAGCADEAEQRRAQLEDESRFWNGLEHKPDIALGNETMPCMPAAANKIPTVTPTQTPTIVQVGARGNQ
jgi:hypothetical protein